MPAVSWRVEDINRSTDATEPVDCTEPHTAETFLVSEFTGKAAEVRP